MHNPKFAHLMVKPQELQIGHIIAIRHTKEYGFIALESVYENDTTVIAASVTAKGEYFGGYQWVTVSFYNSKFRKLQKEEMHIRRDLLLAIHISPDNQ